MEKKANAFIQTGTKPRKIPVIGFSRRLVATLGFLWIAFDKKRQGWHDKIASSYTVDGQADFYAEGNIDFVPADVKPGWLWLVIWLFIALIAPAALLSSLFIMGPALARAITNLLTGLR